ncbi:MULTISPECIES: alpha/beta hydrolase [unclassified Pseudoxanthomonas]|uniref:alpha/beta hydrolase n=1 Tax=unclassified Pseudoxanthomonas TaxID=2645906 RepID=UPI0008E80ADB|nr:MULTISPECIES: alpha/beta hydrolase [unclassified Pseudoxanthomonas]PPJ40996.1 alpha/beta hydrolase [Pseudoxanthomonas sp. KAs_5_3]SFV31550.1 Acetyl esterase/lipase [Pseudoxanthomonas sp. YR558]
MTSHPLFRTGLLVCVLLAALPLPAQTFRERLQGMRDASRQPAARAPTLPAGARTVRDVSYGTDPRQRYDVYLPAQPQRAPVILFVHGGGWANGNKDNPGVVENKAAYWLPKGYVLVSINYRMRPDTAPLDQARDVARALADVQKRAPSWSADPANVMLMGHSAGAHLATLVGASSTLWREAGATRPRGVVSLDSGALDVPQTMQKPPLPGIYDRAFGKDRNDWIASSPYHQLSRDAVPMLFVCSSRRKDACPQGRAMAEKARALGVRMEVLPEDLSHGEVNRLLGAPSAYTEAVARFIAPRMR